MARMRIAGTLFASLCLAGISQPASAAQLQTAVLAGGCYWGVESVYEHVKGVQDVVSGYAGGNRSGLTRGQGDDPGFAEAVRIHFDPAQISYDQLLQIFFEVAHDATQLNRQGPDIGPRYRSAIFPQSAQQRAISQQFLAKLRPQRITTRIEGGGFEVAAPEEQDFVRKHSNVAYVRTYDLPKLAELKRKYPQFWRD
jgi:peptide-methionine (S)-S-oxide reductase